MELEDWNKGLNAWENIKKQALIDIEQAELYISAIQLKIKELKEKK